MVWGKLHDGFHDDPDIVEIGNTAAGAFMRMISYSNDHLTDGELTPKVCQTLAKRRTLTRLLDAKLLQKNERGNYVIRSFLKYNFSRAEVLKEREKTKKRVKRHRECNGVTNTVTPPVTNAVSTGAPTRPVPIDHIYSDEDALDLAALEKLGFGALGAMSPKAIAAIRGLVPVYGHELRAGMSVEPPNWVYLARVIESYRREAGKDRGPPGTKAKKRDPSVGWAAPVSLENFPESGDAEL